MLESIKRSYVQTAQVIPDWKEVSKSELANRYIENENDNIKRNAYFAALMCRYWPAIGKYYMQSKRSVPIEECYEWLIHALMYALKHRKWLEPGNKLFGDLAGPDKVINRCIISTRQIFYQASNTHKRKANYGNESIDKQFDTDDDSSYVSGYTYGENDSYFTESISLDIAQQYIDKNDIEDAIIVDVISHQDSYKLNEGKLSFDLRKTVAALKHLPPAYAGYFIEKYFVNNVDLNSALNKIQTMDGIEMRSEIKKVLYELKSNKSLKEIL